MKILQAYTLILVLLNCYFAESSEMEPCKSFLSVDGRSFQLDRAYQESDLVVIGQVLRADKLFLNVKERFKGQINSRSLQITTPQCQGTSCQGGFSVAAQMDLLFFLKKQSNGIYDSVTGNGNASCPVVFELEKGTVKFKDKLVPIKSLRKFLETPKVSIPL